MLRSYYDHLDRTTHLPRANHVLTASCLRFASVLHSKSCSMPPRRRGNKGKRMGGKLKSSVPATSVDVIAANAAEPPTEPQLEPDTEKATIEVPDSDDDTNSTTAANLKPKKSKTLVDLSPEEEQVMVEWLEANPVLYNKKLTSYKETAKKEKLWMDKASELGKTVDILKTWYASLRSRFGKLKKKHSGSEDAELTERDEWVLRHFEFLRPHIYEVPKKTTVSIKQKLATACDSLAFADETDDNTDQPSQPPSATNTQSEPIPGQSLSSRRRSDKQISKTEEALLAGLEERSQLMMSLNQQILDRLNPSADRERDAFVDWIRSVINALDHDLWRRCQQEISNTLYRYIGENDQVKRQQKSTPSTSSVSRQQPLQGSTQTCSSMWQPPPSQWPTRPTSSVSVWHSQDANWVAQQQQQQALLQPMRFTTLRPMVPSPQLQGDHSDTSETPFSVGQFFNISDPEVQEQTQLEEQQE